MVRGDHDQALDWTEKALQIREDLGDQAGVAQANSQLGLILTDRGNPEEAIPFYLIALAIQFQRGAREAEGNLYVLNHQQELLGEERFGEILRKHLSEKGAVTVLDLMEEIFSEETEDGDVDSPEGTTE